MTSSAESARSPGVPALGPLVRACHPGPAAAVTVLVAAFATSAGSGPGRVALVTAAVLTGQLSIGWSNDLIDAERDRAVQRLDKPMVAGGLDASTLKVACVVAVTATVVLSLACGLGPGLLQLTCVLAGWVYNLGAKATALSWVPYAVAFGLLPVFALAAGPGLGAVSWEVPLAGALLGVGAHLLNVLPDLEQDEATGVRGLPHRLGARRSSVAAVVCLAAATVALLLGPGRVPLAVVLAVVAAVAALSIVALTASGRTPFRAAIGIALVDVALLLVAA